MLVFYPVLYVISIDLSWANGDEVSSYVEATAPFVDISDVGRQAEVWATCVVTYEILEKTFQSKPAQAKQLSDFGNDVNKLNTWFDDTRKNIIKEEGKGKYNEYLRSLFKTYLGCANAEFVESVKDEKRKWAQGKLPVTYDHKDLMELGRVTFNNISQDDEGWSKNNLDLERKKSSETAPNEKNFLALATELIKSIKGNNKFIIVC